jgi:hypothetical protein
MPAANIGGWIRTGVWALPVYGLLTFWATFTHEPNRHTEVEAYARCISTTNYLAQHLLGSILEPFSKRMNLSEQGALSFQRLATKELIAEC